MLNLQEYSMPIPSGLRCDVCGSFHIIADRYYVCAECGYTFPFPLIDIESSILSENGRQGTIQQQHHPYIVGGIIGLPTERHGKYQKLQYIQKQIWINPKQEAGAIFQQLTSHFEISIAQEEFFKLFNRVFSILPPRSKSKNIVLLTTTLFIRLCYRHTLIINLKEVLEYMKINIKNYFYMINRLKRDFPRILDGDLQMRRALARKYIHQLTEQMRLPAKTLNLALKILDHFKLRIGQKPKMQAVAALTLSAHATGFTKIKTYKLAKMLNVAASTAYARVKSIKLKEVISLLNKSVDYNKKSKETQIDLRISIKEYQNQKNINSFLVKQEEG